MKEMILELVVKVDKDDLKISVFLENGNYTSTVIKL